MNIEELYEKYRHFDNIITEMGVTTIESQLIKDMWATIKDEVGAPQ